MFPFAMLLTVALASSARADVAAPRADARPVEQPSDLVSLRFAGVWFSPLSPRAGIVVSPPVGPELETEIHASGRFDAIGYLVDSTFVGIWRPEGGDGATDPSRLGTLTVRPAGRGRLEARFSTRSSDTPPRVETWSRDIAGSRLPPSPKPENPPPGFGGYAHVDQLPVLIERGAMAYPDSAIARGAQGRVTVMVLVDRDGRVRDVHVAESVPGLDESVVAWAREWRFKPAVSHGQPVAAWVAIPVKFGIH